MCANSCIFSLFSRFFTLFWIEQWHFEHVYSEGSPTALLTGKFKLNWVSFPCNLAQGGSGRAILYDWEVNFHVLKQHLE